PGSCGGEATCCATRGSGAGEYSTGASGAGIRLGCRASWGYALHVPGESGGLSGEATDRPIRSADRLLAAQEGVFVVAGAAAKAGASDEAEVQAAGVERAG
ncbi:threonine synthase, partial [Streptomyces albidoflavus]